jgi:REP element-mobilizing transposase RayT
MLYHVVARGNNKQCIHTDETDYLAFLELLTHTLLRFNVRCLAYCLMSNHYHLLLKAGPLPISRLMQQLNSAYCRQFNRRHHRVGHVLQGRFGARLVDDASYTRAVLRYLALNPVLAELVADPLEWRRSSYRIAMGADEPPGFLALGEAWAAFGTSDPATGRSRLATFVRAGMSEDFPSPLLHGSGALARLVAPLLEPHQTTHDYVCAERHAARPSLGTIVDGCVSQLELDQAAHTAFFKHAYTLAEIGAVVSRDPSVVCRWIQRAARRTRPLPPSREDNRARNKI